jgi:hypothetical protein
LNPVRWFLAYSDILALVELDIELPQTECKILSPTDERFETFNTSDASPTPAAAARNPSITGSEIDDLLAEVISSNPIAAALDAKINKFTANLDRLCQAD